MTSGPESSSRSAAAAVEPSVPFWRAVRQALGGAHLDYTVGPLPRAIALLAIPMVLEMVMESAFAVCDIYFVARLGDAAVAAVGLTESMLTIVYAVAIGLAMATTATVARRVGEKNLDGAAAAGAQAIYVGVGAAVLLGAPCWVFAPDLLAWMKADAEVIAEGTTYTRILLGSNGVILLLFLNNAVFRGAGDAVIAMRALWLANGINLVLDPCLIFGLGPFPELGLTGAAIATTCGRGIGVLYQLRALHRGSSRVHLTGPALRWRPDVAVGLLRTASTGIIQFLIATASWVVLMRLVSEFGKSAAAGYTLAIRVIVFTLLPAWGLSNAAATLVGQNLGANQPDRAERAVWLTGVFNMGFLLLVSAVFIVVPRPVLSIFTDDEAVLATGVESLRVISYGYPAYAWGMVLVQAFNGAGDTRTPTWINLFCFWMVQLPLAHALARGAEWGPDGVFWAVASAEALLAVVAIVWFRRGSWKSTVV